MSVAKLEKIGKVLTQLIDGEMTIEEMKDYIREGSTGLLHGTEQTYGDACEYEPIDVALAVAKIVDEFVIERPAAPRY